MKETSAPVFVDGPSRLFRRRGLAFLIDIVIFQLAAYTLLLVIPAISPWNIGFSSIMTTECWLAPRGPLAEQIDREWPLEFGVERTNSLCKVTYAFDSTYYLFHSGSAKTRGIYTWAKWVAVVADDKAAPLPQGEMRRRILLQSAVNPTIFAIVIGLFISTSASGRRTPGKRLLGLRIETPYGISPGLPRAACRELLKFAPVIAGIFATTASTLVILLEPDISISMIREARDMTATNLPVSVLLPAVFGIVQLLWWFSPFIFWRGQTYYDRIADCAVIRQIQNVNPDRSIK